MTDGQSRWFIGLFNLGLLLLKKDMYQLQGAAERNT